MHSVAVSVCISLKRCPQFYECAPIFQDILGGMLLAFFLLPILVPIVDKLDSFLLTHPAAPGLLITTAVTLMLVYPGSKYSSAK